MSAELILFILVATVAIVSAAFMLISRNAVHSALFLVLNFLCVAFFYLMLDAPFLAAIQITVYAGAIMVLFMFVIMLLGADKLGGPAGKYTWIAPIAVGITTVLLIIAFIAVTNSSIGLLKPVAKSPEVGFLHAAPGAPNVDFYLDETLLEKNVAFEEQNAFVAAQAGEHTLVVFPSCTEADAANCVDPITSGAAPLLAQPVTLETEKQYEFVVAGTTAGLQLITVPLDLTEVSTEDMMRVTFVNALPGDALKIDQFLPPNPSNVDEIRQGYGVSTLVDMMAYGAVSMSREFPKGTTTFAIQRGDARVYTLRDIPLKAKTHELIVFAPEHAAEGEPERVTAIRFDDPPLRTAEAYGSPAAVGLSMLSTFVLPFELVSLLLLVALVGAVIMTREEVVKRVRQRIVVSPAIRHLNRNLATQQPSVVQSTEKPSEASAD
jgi:NADH:ubiquinone oxidoreductase subunit 6 (subunit J)